MNYQKIYDNLIYKGKHRSPPENIYCEIHHILPRALGGDDNIENLVVLTAREHFIAHRLLCKITRGNDRYKMMWAVWAMTMKNQKRQLTSYQIATARTALGYPKSNSHKKALSLSMKGTLYATHTVGRTQVTNDEVTKYVTDEDLPCYLNNGWRIGRKTYTDKETYKLIADKNKKSFTLRTPDGTVITVTGMKQFCADNKLTPSCLSRVISGELQYHFGYSCPSHDDKFKNIEPLQQKKFQIRDPDGQIIEIVGISQYCRDNNLDSGAISRVLNGKAKQHKLYTSPAYDSKYKR